MLSYVLKSIKKNKGIFLFMIIGFFTIVFVIPVGISALFTTKAIVNDDITKYSRGKFDLLIRPEEAISDFEKTNKLVEENYLIAGKGGVSLLQYEKIKAINGIEAAAPVSTIGFFTSANNTITVSFPHGKSYHMNTEVYTYDGTKDYLIESNDYYQIASNYNEKDWNLEKVPVMFLPPSVKGFSPARGKMEYPIVLPLVWDMLVSIDPEQENKLIGLKEYTTAGTYFNNEKIEDRIVDNANTKIVPIMLNESTTVPMKIKIKFDNYDLDRNSGSQAVVSIVGSESFKEYYPISNELKEKLDKLPLINSETNTIELSKVLTPFKTPMINLVGDGTNVIIPKTGAGFGQRQGSLYYKASQIEYTGNIDSLRAESIASKDGITLFRKLEEVGSSVDKAYEKNETIIDFKVLGSVKPPESSKEMVAGSPLGIYGDSYAAQIEDEQGNKVDNKQLFPTINPGSFVPAAPRAYTTLESAEYLKGEKPIDAIRVKVSGITKYDDFAQGKIEKIAKEISEATGLHVDIVAGSSTRNIVVSIPGIGKALERWTTLGAAAVIVDSWSNVGFVLVVIFIICGFLFTINRVSCSTASRKSEIGILKAIGWEEKEIARMLCLENSAAGILAVLLGAAAIAVLNNYYNIAYIKNVYALTSAVFISVNIALGYIFGKYTQRGISMIHISLGDIKRKNKRLNSSILSMIFNNVLSYRKKSALLLAQITLAGALSVFTWLLIEAARNFTGTTAMGKKVNASTTEMITILIFGAVMLVIFTVVDRFSTIVMERKNHIGILRTLGWEEVHIVKLITGEAFVLAVLGAFFAAVVSLGSFRLLYSAFSVSIPKLIAAFIAIICVSLIASFYPLYIALKISPIDAIMSRQIRYSIKSFVTKKTMALVLAVLAVIIAVTSISVYYISLNRNMEAQQVVSKNIYSGLLEKISGEELIEDMNKLNSDNDSEKYILEKVKALGYIPKVEEIKADSISAVERDTMKIAFNGMSFKVDRFYINSKLIKEGENTLKKKAYVLGKGYSKSYKDCILILDTDTSEETLSGSWDSFKEAAAIILIPNKPLEYYESFEAQLTYRGKALSKEETLKNITVDIQGKDIQSKPILLLMNYGRLKEDCRASTASALFQILKLYKENKPDKSVRILFSGGGEYDYAAGFRSYLNKEKQDISKVVVLEKLGISKPIIFGRRDDETFGSPMVLLENLDTLQNVHFNMKFTDKDVPFLQDSEKSTNTPNELMSKANIISKALGMSITPIKDDNFAGNACVDEEINYAYLGNVKAGEVKEDILKVHTAFLYEFIRD